MSTAIAFLSGKGGSGKTTLALSTADLLSRCKLHTLLIDCDLSTNGATFFYESHLQKRSAKDSSLFLSFSDCFRPTDLYQTFSPITISPYLDFFPSVSDISSQQKEDVSITTSYYQLPELIKWARNVYDVLLFDCQAGYTSLLPELLPSMDVDIFVLEADSISASALRNLHLKIGGLLGNAKLYQVFNKATPEEYEIYSKIVGTFFTNIGTFLFDWKIRQAFSRSQIPDLKNCSARYGSDLWEMCKIVLPDKNIQHKLSAFSLIIKYRKTVEEREETLIELENCMDNHNKTKNTEIVFIAITAVIFGLLILLIQNKTFDFSSSPTSTILTLMLVLLVACLTLIISLKAGNSLMTRKHRRMLIGKLADENDKVDDMLLEIEKYESNNEDLVKEIYSK